MRLVKSYNKKDEEIPLLVLSDIVERNIFILCCIKYGGTATKKDQHTFTRRLHVLQTLFYF